MMNKIKFLMGLVVGLCIVNIGLMGFILLRSQVPTPPPPGMHPEDRPRHLIIQKLSLDKEQVAKYDELIANHRNTVRSLEKQMMDTKNKLYSTLVSPPGEKDSLVKQLGSLQEQIETVHYNHFLDIKKLCSPEQQQKFNELTTEIAEYFRPPHPPGR
jgi:periplasmic protein CpxP/Spy